MLHVDQRPQLTVVADAARPHAAPQAVHVHELVEHRDGLLETARAAERSSSVSNGGFFVADFALLCTSCCSQQLTHRPVQAELQKVRLVSTTALPGGMSIRNCVRIQGHAGQHTAQGASCQQPSLRDTVAALEARLNRLWLAALLPKQPPAATRQRTCPTVKMPTACGRLDASSKWMRSPVAGSTSPAMRSGLLSIGAGSRRVVRASWSARGMQ